MVIKISNDERLFNLTAALLQSKIGLTKSEILSQVQGYRESFRAGDDVDSLSRKFERDKTTLREMGIHISLENPQWALEDNQEIRYRIPNANFNWPKDVRLNARQVMLLNLAAEVWGKTSLSSDAAQGMMRILALGESPDQNDLVGIAPRIPTHGAAFQPLSDALQTRNTVSFDYRKPGQNESERRTVNPWALENIDGQWLLMCWDVVNQKTRNFLLPRITSTVTIEAEQFETPAKSDIEAMKTELFEHAQSNVAVLRIRRDSHAWFHFEMDLAEQSEPGVLKRHFMDLHLLADQIREYVFDVEVLEPEELRDAVAAGLQKVASDHHA